MSKLENLVRDIVREEIGLALRADQAAAALIVGAESIAEEIFGNAEKTNVRRIYTWSESGALPTIKVGGRIAIGRASLDEFLARGSRT